MFYSIKGKLKKKFLNSVVVETGGIGYRIALSPQILASLPAGDEIELYLYLHLREDGAELFGFATEEEQIFFELLLTVSGVGPRIALGILGLAPVGRLKAAIKSGDAETLVKAFGVGRRTAERITVELKNKIEGEAEAAGEAKIDAVDALVGLGYSRRQAQEAVRKVGSDKSPEETLKEALRQIK
jgi:Holliday junction DNA helicase RuvA